MDVLQLRSLMGRGRFDVITNVRKQALAAKRAMCASVPFFPPPPPQLIDLEELFRSFRALDAPPDKTSTALAAAAFEAVSRRAAR